MFSVDFGSILNRISEALRASEFYNKPIYYIFSILGSMCARSSCVSGGVTSKRVQTRPSRGFAWAPRLKQATRIGKTEVLMS